MPARALFKPLRPYGGTAVLPAAMPGQLEILKAANLEKAEVKQPGLWTTLRRVGRGVIRGCRHTSECGALAGR